jgi:hypothetical protein
MFAGKKSLNAFFRDSLVTDLRRILDFEASFVNSGSCLTADLGVFDEDIVGLGVHTGVGVWLGVG